MKKYFKVFACLSASFLMAATASAAKVELYALDGRSLFVEEDQVEVYTAEGMGWFKEKPVTMYAQDGRTIVVPADSVEDYKNVGWFLEGELNSENKQEETVTPSAQEDTKKEETVVQKQDSITEKISIKYTDGTIISVPAYELEMYKALGWVKVDSASSETNKVAIYDANGVSKEVDASEVGKYELEGWSTKKPDVKYITVYSQDGSEKEVAEAQLEAVKAEGWFKSYDEAVYDYAAFGNRKDILGAVALLENKKYEQAFNMVQDAIEKIESTGSEYVTLLYYLRSSVTDAWREAANSPLGFINYWFSDKDGSRIAVYEYRNVSNSRIQSFKIDFDICGSDGEIIESNSGSYFINNLQMAPCEKKRVAWKIKSGNDAAGIKNLKVMEVVFSDGTEWKASN